MKERTTIDDWFEFLEWGGLRYGTAIAATSDELDRTWESIHGGRRPRVPGLQILGFPVVEVTEWPIYSAVSH